jgi:hypothetical protein
MSLEMEEQKISIKEKDAQIAIFMNQLKKTHMLKAPKGLEIHLGIILIKIF